MMTALAFAVALTLCQADVAPPAPPPQESMATAPLNPKPSEPPTLSRVILKDGQVLRGVLVSQDEQHVVLDLPAGGRMDLAAALVERVEADPKAQLRDNGEVWTEDPNRTRYLYAPSGLMLRQGEGYFSQKELLFSAISYGLTDNLTLQAGAVLPAWFAEGGFNFIAGVKVGGSVTERFHLAAGAQGLFIPSLLDSSSAGVVGLLFGTATYGTPDAHISLALGKPFQLASESASLPSLYIIAVSGNLRVSRSVALVTENWVLPSLYQPGSNASLPMVNSLAARLFGEHWAVDLGLIRLSDVAIPVPWLDFSYNFGG